MPHGGSPQFPCRGDRPPELLHHARPASGPSTAAPGQSLRAAVRLPTALSPMATAVGRSSLDPVLGDSHRRVRIGPQPHAPREHVTDPAERPWRDPRCAASPLLLRDDRLVRPGEPPTLVQDLPEVDTRIQNCSSRSSSGMPAPLLNEAGNSSPVRGAGTSPGPSGCVGAGNEFTLYQSSPFSPG